MLLQIYQQLIQLEFTNNTQQWMQLHQVELKLWQEEVHSLEAFDLFGYDLKITMNFLLKTRNAV